MLATSEIPRHFPQGRDREARREGIPKAHQTLTMGLKNLPSARYGRLEVGHRPHNHQHALPEEVHENGNHKAYALHRKARGQLKSLQKLISKMTMVHYFLSNEIESRERDFGIPLAKIRSGVVPWSLKNTSWVSSTGNIHFVMRWGTVVHSVFPSAAEKPRWLYLGCC
jgi:hypothetical protein